MTEYDPWALYYDQVFHGLPGEAEFYVGQACRLEGPVLEIGCGTGRLAIAMAMSGADVVGVDESRRMLAVCAEKDRAVGPKQGRLQLVQADMCQLPFECRFGFAAMAYRTFMHAHSPQDQRACLASVYRALRPGGVFIVNTWAARASAIRPHLDSPRDTMQWAGRYALPEGGALIHTCASSYDDLNQTIGETHLIQETDESGRVIALDTLQLVRTWTYPREMLALIEGTGFQIEAVFGDFDCNIFGRDSREFICVARKTAKV